MRISGLATGLDTDNMVKEMMKPYQLRVDRIKQDNTQTKYKQEIYRDILKESGDFYNKYFTVSSEDSILNSGNWKTVDFDSEDSSVVTATGNAGAEISNYTVEVKSIAAEASLTLKSDSLFTKDGALKSNVIKINGKEINIEGSSNVEEVSKKINEFSKENEIEIDTSFSQFSDGLVIKTKGVGKEEKLNIEFNKKTFEEKTGTDAEVIIKNKNGEEYIHKGDKNILTLDGVIFKFNGAKEGESISLKGKNSVDKTKDLIINMVNDYNKLIENVNKQILTKHNKTYKPLSEEERKDMSEDQQKLWDKKSKEGLLRGDMHLRKLVDGMKNIMRSSIDGLKLEDIGIVPVKNYGEKNGMFTIDESKLEKSLKENPKKVKELFLQPSIDEENTSTGGVATRLKDLLYKQTVSVSSPLMKKAGKEGSVTAFNNQLSKTMEKKEKMLAKMESDLAKRENDFYLQFSRLETQMSKLNNQSAYLMSQLGGGM